MSTDIKSNTDNDTRNKRKPWQDWELREILRDVPTKDNIERWSRAFKRGRGSIMLVYRWAYAPKHKVDHLLENSNNRYVFAIRVWKIARELGIVV